MKYVILDLEMCKVPKSQREEYRKSRETIQIGAVLMNEDYEIIDKFMTYIHPSFGRMDSFINRLTGITYENVNQAPDFIKALKLFLDWIPDEEVTMVSWSDSDQLQLMHEREIFQIDNDKFNCLLDNWMDCQALFGAKMGVADLYSLDNAIIATGVNIEGRAHDGLVDAENTALIFKKVQTESELILNEDYRKAHYGISETLTYSLGDLIAQLNSATA